MGDSCHRGIKILVINYTAENGACGPNKRTFSCCGEYRDCMTLMQLFVSSALQIPMPSVPTYQPTTSIPQRLEAIQKYIRDLQYPFLRIVNMLGSGHWSASQSCEWGLNYKPFHGGVAGPKEEEILICTDTIEYNLDFVSHWDKGSR